MVRLMAGVAVLAGIVMGVYGYFEGVPESDIVFATRSGDVAQLARLLHDDSALARTKVYPQAAQRAGERRAHRARTGQDPWQGKYLVHEALENGGAYTLPMLGLLASAGADLQVRRHGRTLLHEAARAGHIDAAQWLIDHGVDVNAVNDCSDACAERGWTPLHDAQYTRAADMATVLLDRGAQVDVADAIGRGALHVAAAWQELGGVFVLCRYGADPARVDGQGLTAADLALRPTPRPTGGHAQPDDPALLAAWLAVDGGCATVSAAARRAGAPVPDEDARAAFSAAMCARGQPNGCAKR